MIAEYSIAEFAIGETEQATSMGTLTTSQPLVVRDPKPNIVSTTPIQLGQNFDLTKIDEGPLVDFNNASTITATLGGVNCPYVSHADGNNATFTAPTDGLQLGTNADLIVTVDGYASDAYSTAFSPVLGQSQTFTVDYANLHPDSPWSGDATVSGLVTGDQIDFAATSSPGGYAVSISGDGLVTLTGWTDNITQTVDYAFIDASDSYSRGTQGILTMTGTQTVSQSAELRWNIHETVQASSQIVWDMSATVEQSAQIQWSVEGDTSTVQNTLQAVWNVEASTSPVSQILQVDWNISEAVTQSNQIIWDVDANTLTVSNDHTISWNINQTIQQQVEVSWNMTEQVSNGYQISWTIQTDAVRKPLYVVKVLKDS